MDSQINDRVEDALSEHRWVEALAEQWQGALKRTKADLPRGPAVASVLHGEPLGHPLHPILVHLPLGGWLVTGLLDFLPGGQAHEREQAADLALLLGTLGSVATIAAGWTDWSNTRGQARRTGLIHGALNEVAFF